MINTIARNIITRTLKTIPLPAYYSSNSIINKPPSKYADARTQLKENVWRDPDPSGTVIIYL